MKAAAANDENREPDAAEAIYANEIAEAVADEAKLTKKSTRKKASKL